MPRGRPQRPHKCSWDGKLIPGLYKCPDGRWRITATGERFTEPDERKAVARFLAMQEQKEAVELAVATTTADEVGPALRTALRQEVVVDVERDHRKPVKVSRVVTGPEFWATVTELLLFKPALVAKMTGLHDLATYRHTGPARPAIKLDDLIDIYKRENPSTDKSKREAVAVFNRLIAFADAKTLDDLTQEKLQAFRRDIETSGKLQSPATRAAYYGRIKTIISFGLKVAMDQQQIRAALDRCKVLWTAEALPPVKPQPIARDDFHALLAVANDQWRAWLLLALNLCMTAEDLCELRWADFDLDKGTFAAIRRKTRRDRIPRAGTLWSETIDAMNRLERRGPFVFTSSHGTRYNRNTRVNDFAELRERAKLPEDVKFNNIRDAAYTVACQATTDERWARVLAGHRAAGLQDNYVLRNPEATRPACEAVHRAYGPFPVAVAVA